MATFKEVRDHLESMYTLVSSDDENVRIDIPLPNDRRQKVTIKLIIERNDWEYLQLISMVAPASKIDFKSCLSFNANYLGAHLALLDHEGEEMIVMCDTQYLRTLNMPELDKSIKKVVRAADGLEGKLFSEDIH